MMGVQVMGHSKMFWDGFLLRTVLGCSSEREL